MPPGRDPAGAALRDALGDRVPSVRLASATPLALPVVVVSSLVPPVFALGDFERHVASPPLRLGEVTLTAFLHLLRRSGAVAARLVVCQKSSCGGGGCPGRTALRLPGLVACATGFEPASRWRTQPHQ